MNRTRVFAVWAMMAAAVALVAYLVGASWIWAIVIGILAVAAIVGGFSGYMYWQQRRLLKSAAAFDIDLKSGKIHPANLRRMYFSGGQARKDALFIASRAMNCSMQEAERELGKKMGKPR